MKVAFMKIYKYINEISGEKKKQEERLKRQTTYKLYNNKPNTHRYL